MKTVIPCHPLAKVGLYKLLATIVYTKQFPFRVSHLCKSLLCCLALGWLESKPLIKRVTNLQESNYVTFYHFVRSKCLLDLGTMFP